MITATGDLPSGRPVLLAVPGPGGPDRAAPGPRPAEPRAGHRVAGVVAGRRSTRPWPALPRRWSPGCTLEGWATSGPRPTCGCGPRPSCGGRALELRRLDAAAGTDVWSDPGIVAVRHRGVRAVEGHAGPGGSSSRRACSTRNASTASRVISTPPSRSGHGSC